MAAGIGKWHKHFGKLIISFLKMNICSNVPEISLIGINPIDVSHPKTSKIVYSSFIHYNSKPKTI